MATPSTRWHGRTALVTGGAGFRRRRLAGNVTLGRGAVVGVGAVISPCVTIGDNAVVTAGSVVTDDVAANTLVGGHPARVLRSAIVGYNDVAA
jgi:acetyltransferase-like isoleucine patch superfamily enzyme